MKKLKIILVRPNYHTHLVTPPLGLGYISSYLKSRGYTPRIIDGLNLGCSMDELVNLCKGADVVGINCLSAYFREVAALSRKLKEQGSMVVIGGPHATALPQLTLEETQADYVIAGEGEAAFADLLDGISGKTSLLQERAIKRPFIKDLDSLPFPDWEQMDPRTYKKAPHGGLVKSFPVAPITSSRGCPFACTFCASPSLWGRTIRFRSPQNVVDEIEYLIREFGVKEIHFEDDNLTLKREHAEKICELILQRNIKINWATPNGVRAETLDLELLKLMKKSGCYSIAFGIESGSEKILNRVRKRTNLGIIEKAVNLSKKAGILTQGFFIFGLPGETKETIDETIRFAKRLPLDKAQFMLLDVIPGSELWESLVNSRSVDWDYRSYQEVTWVPEGLDEKTLACAPARAFRTFYLRPRPMLFVLRYFRLSQISFLIRRAIDFGIVPFAKYWQKKDKNIK